MTDTSEPFESWGIVSLFGHKKVAGRITEQTIGGETFIRVDLPEEDDTTRFKTKLFGKGAIYEIQITDEEIARAATFQYQVRPVEPLDVSAYMKLVHERNLKQLSIVESDYEESEGGDIPY